MLRLLLSTVWLLFRHGKFFRSVGPYKGKAAACAEPMEPTLYILILTLISLPIITLHCSLATQLFAATQKDVFSITELLSKPCTTLNHRTQAALDCAYKVI